MKLVGHFASSPVFRKERGGDGAICTIPIRCGRHFCRARRESILLDEIHSYDDIRALREATALICRVRESTVVLGSSQFEHVLAPHAAQRAALRRRRGGGGAVLLEPRDLWIDWWIPADDSRFDGDLSAQAIEVGRWWVEALSVNTNEIFEIHVGPMVVDQRFAVACFAGVASGEVMHEGRKVVGITQWRVREGALVSTLLCSKSSSELPTYLRESSTELVAALEHDSLTSLGLSNKHREIEASLLSVSGSWVVKYGPLSVRQTG